MIHMHHTDNNQVPWRETNLIHHCYKMGLHMAFLIHTFYSTWEYRVFLNNRSQTPLTLKFVMCLLGFILSRYAAQYEFPWIPVKHDSFHFGGIFNYHWLFGKLGTRKAEGREKGFSISMTKYCKNIYLIIICRAQMGS